MFHNQPQRQKPFYFCLKCACSDTTYQKQNHGKWGVKHGCMWGAPLFHSFFTFFCTLAFFTSVATRYTYVGS